MTITEAEYLRSLTDEAARLDHLKEIIEPTYFDKYPEFKAESDKAWDAIHRALADGQLSWEGGSYPLTHTILAGELLYTQSDYIISLKTPKEVRDIAAALPIITEADFRQRYFAIDCKSYQFPLTEDDFSYTWAWFQDVRDFYTRAAKHERFVLFSVDRVFAASRRLFGT